VHWRTEVSRGDLSTYPKIEERKIGRLKFPEATSTNRRINNFMRKLKRTKGTFFRKKRISKLRLRRARTPKEYTKSSLRSTKRDEDLKERELNTGNMKRKKGGTRATEKPFLDPSLGRRGGRLMKEGNMKERWCDAGED